MKSYKTITEAREKQTFEEHQGVGRSNVLSTSKLAEYREAKGIIRWLFLPAMLCWLLLGSAFIAEANDNVNIMSFNILRESWAPSGAPSWAAREADVIQAIEDENPDFVGTQEESSGQMEDVLDALPAYSEVPDRGVSGGIMYLHAKWDLVDSGKTLFVRNDVGGSAKNRYYIWGLFSQKTTNRMIYVYTNHLPTSSQASTSDRVFAMEQMGTHAAQRLHQTVPVILTGDFNARSYENIMETLTGEVGNLPINFIYAYEDSNISGVTHGIDHILALPGTNVVDSGVAANEKWDSGSDHPAVFAVVKPWFGNLTGYPENSNIDVLDRSNWSLSATNGNNKVSLAIDGNPATRWDTGQFQQPGQRFNIDLGSTQSFDSIELEAQASPQDYPRGYTVRVSNNGVNYTNVASGSGSGAITVINFAEQLARYIRIEQTGTSSNKYWSIHELNVYASGGSWTSEDVGNVGNTGSADINGNGQFAVEGPGANIAGGADEFHYVYQPLIGDGEITAQVVSLENTASFAKAGVMMRETLDDDSKYAFTFARPSTSVAARFYRRTSEGSSQVNTTGDGSLDARWVRITRTGNLFTSSESADGVNWDVIDTETIAMDRTIYIGLATTSAKSASFATAVFDNVEAIRWASTDVGNVAAAGSTTINGNGRYVIEASGENIAISGGIDEFHYTYQPLVGDGQITAQIVSLENTDTWAKAGVMIRETFDDDSKYAYTFARPNTTYRARFYRRESEGSNAISNFGSSALAARWLRINRTGNVFTSSESADGVTWQNIGNPQTIPMNNQVYIGLAVTSRNDGVLATAVIDNVEIER